MDIHAHISVFLSFHIGLQVEPCHLKCSLNFGLCDKIADIFWAVCGEPGGHALWPVKFVSAVIRNSRIIAMSTGIPLDTALFLYEIAQVDTNQLIVQVQMHLLSTTAHWQLESQTCRSHQGITSQSYGKGQS